jgi:hypothetical protein
MHQMHAFWQELCSDILNVPHMRQYLGNNMLFTVRDMFTAVQKMNSALNCVIRDHADWKPE